MEALTEARFTGPSLWCPRPDLWTSTDEDSTEIEVSELIAGLVRGVQPDLCVETGAAFGQTAEAIGQALAENGHGRLVSLEPDGDRAEFARDRCVGLPVEVRQAESLEYIPDGRIGFAFFDSLFPLRVPEFNYYRRWMEPGTVVVFHDSAPGHGGGQFTSGLDLRGELDGLGIPLLHLRTPRGVTIGQVPS